MLRCLPAVTRSAQTAAVPRVIRVEATLDKLAPAQRVVIGVNRGRLPAEDADPVARKHARPEPLLVLPTVSALPC